MNKELKRNKILDKNEIKFALDAIMFRTRKTLHRINGLFPYYANQKTGEWHTTEDGNWCAGHWIGLLWIASQLMDGNEQIKLEKAARSYTEKVMHAFQNFENSLFSGMNFFYIGFRAFDLTGEQYFRDIGFRGADVIRKLYNPIAQQVPSGEFRLIGPGPIHYSLPNADTPENKTKDWLTAGYNASAVDSVYVSLPILWKSYKESNDQQYFDIAYKHLDIYLDRFIRTDGSTRQKIVFNPETGEPVKEYYDLAYSKDGCWARGLGWCIAGLAEAYNALKSKHVLNFLERCTEFYVSFSPEDIVTFWDLLIPEKQNTVRDTSAAALVAYGLVRLQGQNDRIDHLRDIGRRILASLIHNYLISNEKDPRLGMIMHGCYNKPAGFAIDNELIWTNYYIAYSLQYLLEQKGRKYSNS